MDLKWAARMATKKEIQKVGKTGKRKEKHLVDLLDFSKVARKVKRKEKYSVDSMGLKKVVRWE